jgi:hypothetical protein
MHSGGERPASCAILRSNEVHKLVVCHTVKSGRKEIGFKRHFLPPTRKQMKTWCSYLIMPLCQTTGCYTQQYNHLSASSFPTKMPVWSKKTCWDKNRMIILHHLEWHLTLLPVNRKYITFRLQWQCLKLWSCQMSEQRMLSAVPTPTNNHHLNYLLSWNTVTISLSLCWLYHHAMNVHDSEAVQFPRS